MRKPLLILAATAVLASGTAFAATSQAADQPAAQSTPAKHKVKKAKTNRQNAAPATKKGAK